jgi:hypothetical protein
MAFGAPTRYIQLDPVNVEGMSWDVRNRCTQQAYPV